MEIGFIGFAGDLTYSGHAGLLTSGLPQDERRLTLIEPYELKQ
jgi:hypothetical protein